MQILSRNARRATRCLTRKDKRHFVWIAMRTSLQMSVAKTDSTASVPRCSRTSAHPVTRSMKAGTPSLSFWTKKHLTTALRTLSCWGHTRKRNARTVMNLTSSTVMSRPPVSTVIRTTNLTRKRWGSSAQIAINQQNGWMQSSIMTQQTTLFLGNIQRLHVWIATRIEPFQNRHQPATTAMPKTTLTTGAAATHVATATTRLCVLSPGR